MNGPDRPRPVRDPLRDVGQTIVDRVVEELLERVQVLALPDRLMKADEAAGYLQMSLKSVHELAARGQIPCGRFGRSLRFSARALDEWASQREPAPSRRAS